MTIALGIRTPEGVVCATDSMRTSWSSTGWATVDLDGTKHERLSDRLYYVVSGRFRDVGEPLLGFVDEGQAAGLTVDQVAPLMWAEVVLRMMPAAETHDRRESPAALLVAGGPKGQPPGLAMYRSDRLPTVAPGAVVVGGAIREWADAHGVADLPAPPSLEAAVELAVDICRRNLEDMYRGWGIEELLDTDRLREQLDRPGGLIPPSAFPLHLVAITADEVAAWEVER